MSITLSSCANSLGVYELSQGLQTLTRLRKSVKTSFKVYELFQDVRTLARFAFTVRHFHERRKPLYELFRGIRTLAKFYKSCPTFSRAWKARKGLSTSRGLTGRPPKLLGGLVGPVPTSDSEQPTVVRAARARPGNKWPALRIDSASAPPYRLTVIRARFILARPSPAYSLVPSAPPPPPLPPRLSHHPPNPARVRPDRS